MVRIKNSVLPILIFQSKKRLQIGSTHHVFKTLHNKSNSCKLAEDGVPYPQKTSLKLKRIIDKSLPSIKLVLRGINHARRVKQLSSIFLVKMRTVSIKSRRATLKECLIGIYTLLYKASLSKSTLSHGVCQLGMQPNQVCPVWNAKKGSSEGCKNALTMAHTLKCMIGTTFHRKTRTKSSKSKLRFFKGTVMPFYESVTQNKTGSFSLLAKYIRWFASWI